MPALDKYHFVVKDALIREGWIITHDPYSITIGSRPAQIDLGAEMPIAAEKEGRRVAIEIKSFLGPSELYDLYQALGQFGVYNAVLAERDPERALCPPRRKCVITCSTNTISATFSANLRPV